MQIETISRPRRYPSLTSLIDVIFLLLLFFMLSSTFSKYSEVELSSAKSGPGNGVEKPALFIQLSKDEWRINGQRFAKSEVAQFLAEFDKDDDAQAVLRVSEDASAQDLVDAVNQLRLADISPKVIR
ncbi:MAG: biopolymer transporter ExbD [Pseudomonadota bacterium]